MRTLCCREPGKLELTDTPVPAPGPGEVLLRVRRVGVCGTDLHAFSGRQPFLSYPRVLGHELGCEVRELGPGVQGFTPGDRVVVVPYLSCGRCIACRRGRPNCCRAIEVLGVHKDGGMCEYLAVPQGALIPAGDLHWDAAALVECHAIGAHAVARAGIEPGEQALVIGCGPIGLATLQLARIAGAEVIALDFDAQRLRFCRDTLGLAPERTVAAGEGARRAVEELTGGDFPTVVFDATGNAESMRTALDFVAHGGRLVFVGLVQGEIAFPDPELHKREATLLASRNALPADFAWVIACLGDGRLAPTCMVTHRTDLGGAVEGFPRWSEPGSGTIKALLEL